MRYSAAYQGVFYRIESFGFYRRISCIQELDMMSE